MTQRTAALGCSPCCIQLQICPHTRQEVRCESITPFGFPVEPLCIEGPPDHRSIQARVELGALGSRRGASQSAAVKARQPDTAAFHPAPELR